MSQENVELAREVFDAVTQQDLARLVELTDPEVEWQSFFAPDVVFETVSDGRSTAVGGNAIEGYMREFLGCVPRRN